MAEFTLDPALAATGTMQLGRHVDIAKRLLGISAILGADTPKPVGVDLDGIVRRLILFDTYILKTLRFQEFPFLVAKLGFDGTMELLRSPAFGIECESVAMTQIGQLNVLSSRTEKGLLPNLSYCISAIDAADHQRYVHDCLQPLHEIPGLKHKEITKLKRAISDKLIRLPDRFAANISGMATAELLGKPHLVRQSVVLAVEQMMNVKLREFEIAVHAIDREDIRVETDIPERLKLDLPTAHKIIERALLGVAGLVHRFAEMEAYSAISGFIEEDLPLVSEQLDFLAKSISPAAKEQQFRRVVTMAGFPDFSAASDQRKVNMARLMEIRETNECREFREWLPSIAAASDKEIRERIESLRSRLGNLVSTAGGKAVRLLATTGIGCIPVVGPMAGLVAGAIDTFLLEKLLPKSGPVAFLSRLYPSVFDQRET